MNKNELYMRLDTIKLALESSATLLGQSRITSLTDGQVERTLSTENIKLINTTVFTAGRMLRQIMTEELSNINKDDQEEDD